VDSRWNHIITALRHVDVIIGVDFTAQRLGGEIGDNLVGVHIARGARAGLKDINRKVRIVITRGNRFSGLNNGGGDICIQIAQIAVSFGTGGLNQAKRLNKSPRHWQFADGKVVHRTLGLCAIARRYRHLKLTHAVFFNPKSALAHHHLPGSSKLSF
jgi:hypothetical protein